MSINGKGAVLKNEDHPTADNFEYFHDDCLVRTFEVSERALWRVIMVSWGIAFFEYCFQVPANRIGS